MEPVTEDRDFEQRELMLDRVKLLLQLQVLVEAVCVGGQLLSQRS